MFKLFPKYGGKLCRWKTYKHLWLDRDLVHWTYSVGIIIPKHVHSHWKPAVSSSRTHTIICHLIWWPTQCDIGSFEFNLFAASPSALNTQFTKLIYRMCICILSIYFGPFSTFSVQPTHIFQQFAIFFSINIYVRRILKGTLNKASMFTFGTSIFHTSYNLFVMRESRWLSICFWSDTKI